MSNNPDRKQTRRVHGEGSVFQRGDGTWVARIDIEPGPNGKRRQRSRRASSEKDAIKKLRALRRDSEAVSNFDGLKRSVADAVETYMATKSFGSQSTADTTRWRADVIVGGLGRTRIGDLTVIQCDQFISAAGRGEFGRRPISIDGQRRIRRLLINSLRNEMRLGNLATNVADLTLQPQAAPAATGTNGDDDGDDAASIRRTLTHDEYRRLWRSARHPLAVIIDLCGRNGLRPSEARALRWPNIDLEAMTIAVDRQLSKGNRLTRPKTKRAARKIPIDDLTADVLTNWRRQQETKRTQAGARWSAEPEFAVSTRYGTAIESSNLRRMVTAACEDAGVERIVPYELRHTAITFQVEAGNEAWQVADWAGTSVRMVEDIYRHRLHEVARLRPVVVPDLDI